MASADPLANITIGYPKLAARIEIQPDLSIYRGFRALNAQNILYLQAQLIELEAKLRTQQARDDTNPHGKKALYAKTWFWLEKSASDGDTKQLDLVVKIRQVLSEYSKLADEINSELSPLTAYRPSHDPTIHDPQAARPKPHRPALPPKLPRDRLHGPKCAGGPGRKHVGLNARARRACTRSRGTQDARRERRTVDVGGEEGRREPFYVPL